MVHKVSRATALEVITRLREELNALPTPRSSEDPILKRWLEKARSAARNLFGEESPESTDLRRLSFRAEWFGEFPPSQEQKVFALENGLGDARNLVSIWHDQIASFWGDEPAPISSSALATALRACDRLHGAALKLRRRRAGRTPLLMADEYDVQYLLGALLSVDFDDVVAEDYVPTYAGGTSRIDFVLRPERIAIETKMTRDSLGDREVGAQLLVDIARYEARSDVDTLICLVYDPDHHIDNGRGLEADLERNPGRLRVRVLVRP